MSTQEVSDLPAEAKANIRCLSVESISAFPAYGIIFNSFSRSVWVLSDYATSSNSTYICSWYIMVTLPSTSH